jgi:hypothetical protein
VCARRVRIGVADQVKKILGTGGAPGQGISSLQHWLDQEENDFANDLVAELGSSHPLAQRYRKMRDARYCLPRYRQMVKHTS